MDAVSNNFIIELSDSSIKYLKVNRYGEFKSGKYPSFQPNQPRKEKYSKNDLNKMQYEEMGNELKAIIEDGNQYINLSQNIKSQIIEKIKTFTYII